MRFLLLPLLLLAGAVAPAGALAGTATWHAGEFSFTAAPDEMNYVFLTTETVTCDGLPAPCLSFSDRPDHPLNAPAPCVADAFAGIRCPIPKAVTIDTGDMTDVVRDWDGPSLIKGGGGDDAIRGMGGDDVLAGEAGQDVLIGGRGDDMVTGGGGDDVLESFIDGQGVDGGIMPSDTAGADNIIGGEGRDTVSYEAREDPVSVTIDGVADDGGAGEGDHVFPGVEGVRGGTADDTIVGDDGPTFASGLGGDDTLIGNGGGDDLDGGNGDDALSGGSGGDAVKGGGGRDLVDGGAGRDYLYGEYSLGCVIQLCAGGDDVLRARDGESDLIDCGEADDRAIADRIDVMDELRSCEGVAVGKPCAGVPRATRAVCLLLDRAVKPCRALAGRQRAKCLKRAARRATVKCRHKFHGQARTRCVRSVRRVVRR